MNSKLLIHKQKEPATTELLTRANYENELLPSDLIQPNT